MSWVNLLAINDGKKRCGALNLRHELYPRFSHVVKNKFSGTNPLPPGARFSFGLTPSGFVCLAAVEEDFLLHRTSHPLQPLREVIETWREARHSPAARVPRHRGFPRCRFHRPGEAPDR